MDKVRTAFIGVGYRGKQLFRLLQNIPFFQVQAVADPGVKSSEISGIPCYNQGEDACLDMLKEHHPELVFIASPWQYHVQHALLCVEHGCHVALEIKGGLYIDEYTPLMELAEQHGCRVYPLENTLFMRENLSILNIVESGLLGEIVYMRGAIGTTCGTCCWTMRAISVIGKRRKASGVASSIKRRTVTFIPPMVWLPFA